MPPVNKAPWKRQHKDVAQRSGTGEVYQQESDDEDWQQGNEEGDHQETDSRQGLVLYMLNVVTECYKQQQCKTTE